jgi:predicted O-methyltransferase YrrM
VTDITPEQQQKLQEHVQAIAKILYDDTPVEKLVSLAGIEEAVRTQMHKHVMPEVGVFLSQLLQAQGQGINENSKAFLENCP